MKRPATHRSILIVEDDPEQRRFLSEIVLEQVHQFAEEFAEDENKRKSIKNIQLVKVTNLASLEKALHKIKSPMLTILDCNLPDHSGGEPHDQLVKSDHKITGEHRGIDLIKRLCPESPIAMISSMKRFRAVVLRYYSKYSELDIDFISKSEPNGIKRKVREQLRQLVAV